MNRAELAYVIVNRLRSADGDPALQFRRHGYFVVDDLLPAAMAERIFAAFPPSSDLTLRNTIRERKLVTSQMDRGPKLLEEAVFAFQDPGVVRAVAEIAGLEAVEPDDKLYAGGVSVMTEGHYLHPHLDNSHDMERRKYRVLNLLYYTTPQWEEAFGGSLELWPTGRKGRPSSIAAKFNRLLVIATNRTSWHSVNEIRCGLRRTCVSNYYFSEVSPAGEDYFHVTSFRGRPEQPITNLILRADAALRNLLRKIRPTGVVKTKHYYHKPTASP